LKKLAMATSFAASVVRSGGARPLATRERRGGEMILRSRDTEASTNGYTTFVHRSFSP